MSIPLVLAAAMFQSVFPQAGPLTALKPDAVLVMVAMAGLLLSFRVGLILALLSGLELDLFSGMPFGFVTLLLLLVVCLVRLPNRDLVEVNPLVCMAVVAMATDLYYAIYCLTIIALGGDPGWSNILTSVVVPSMTMNSLLSPVIFVIYRLLGRRALPVREDWQ
ncbi:MAG: rod shape-determining protein MreD [Dehalococcoidia bacterium]|nr:rod shape-determining protein MreD [Dehalococcoidia bacterium]